MSKSNLSSNELCKKLNEESHQHATIPDSMRFSAHFEYEDLVKRLLKLQEASECQLQKKSISKLDLKLELKTNKSIKNALKSKNKQLSNAFSDRVIRNKEKAFLPLIRTPKNRLINKEPGLGSSAEVIKKLKYSLNLKLRPIKLRRELLAN